MPSSLEQVMLTVDEVAVACAVLSLPGHELLERPEARARLAGLSDAGVVDADGALVEPAAAIVRVLARAEVKLDLQVWRSTTNVVEHRAWADASDAVIARVGPAGFDLKRVAWEHLPLAVAVRLGILGVGVPVDEQRDRLTVAPGPLLAARSLMLAGDGVAARASVEQQDAGPRAVDDALGLAQGLRIVWSVASAWREPDGTAHGGSLSALDGGPSGWWRLEPDAESASLHPTDPRTLWTALHALLPREVQA